MSYKFQFDLLGLPETTNASSRHGSWFARANHAKKWKMSVYFAVAAYKPKAPLRKAKLTLIRHSTRRPDYDGLVSSFKRVIDGLVESEIIVNDTHEVIGVPDYQWKPAKPRKGYITVTIEEVA